MPLTALLWLAIRDWRRAVLPIAIGAGAAALGLMICIAVYGDVFLANLLTARPYRVMRAINGLGRLQWIAPAPMAIGSTARRQSLTASHMRAVNGTATMLCL